MFKLTCFNFDLLAELDIYDENQSWYSIKLVIIKLRF